MLKVEPGERMFAAEDLPKLARAYSDDVAWPVDPDAVHSHRGRLAMAARELRKLKAKDLERAVGFMSGPQARDAAKSEPGIRRLFGR